MPKPLQFNQILNVTGDPETGKKNVWQIQTVQDELSDMGGLNHGQENLQIALHCGHYKPPGCICLETGCHQTSCVDCQGVCDTCKKPICPEHSRYLELSNRPPVRLCSGCHAKALRRHRTLVIVKTVLSPFVRFEKQP